MNEMLRSVLTGDLPLQTCLYLGNAPDDAQNSSSAVYSYMMPCVATPMSRQPEVSTVSQCLHAAQVVCTVRLISLHP